MIRPEPLRGIFAPILTPFRDDYSPDIERWIVHAQWLLENGCHGLAPFGTTSEANSFSVEERVGMLERLVGAGLPASQMIVGVGCCAFTDSVRLAAHAAELGCGGVLMLPPFYYKDVTDDGIFRTIAEVIERVNDNRLRVYLYHIPPIAKVGFSLDLIERLITMYPQTIVGLKDSSGDWNNTNAILEKFFGFGTFTGTERFLLQTLRGGGVGTISAMANIIPGILRELYDNWQNAAIADQLQTNANAGRTSLLGYAAIPALKVILAEWRKDPAWLTCRPPLVKMNSAQAEEVLAKFPISAQIEVA